MQVRCIASTELEQFTAAGPHPMGADGFAAYVRDLWEHGGSQPERCFVIERGGEIVGRIGYRSGEEAGYFGLALPWSGDYLTVGECLLRESLADLRRAGAQRVERFLTSTWETASQERALLDRLGVSRVQEKVRVTWRDAGQPLDAGDRLVVRTLSEVGEAAFIDVIRRVSAGSLDRLEQLERSVLGEEAYAREYVHVLTSESEPRPDWWLIADTPQGDRVGHVIVMPFDEEQREGTIGYIGVVPEQRGRGYIHDLLTQGLRVLRAGGMQAVICDTDALNHPMLRAFERQGFEPTGQVWVYNARLDALAL